MSTMAYEDFPKEKINFDKRFGFPIDAADINPILKDHQHGHHVPQVRTATRDQIRSTEERFWSHVDRTAECWIWTASVKPNGYGQFGIRRGRLVYAHRFAFELIRGPIPPTGCLEHVCGVRACVNPAHLEVSSTRIQNARATPVPNRRGTPEERFWSKVEKTASCWNWTHSKIRGYGAFSVHGSQVYAHRFSFVLHFGPIPDLLQVDHMCHNPACVNPSHLRLVTNKQNQENRSGPARDNKTGVRGVCWDRRAKRWRATVNHNGHQYHAGQFRTLDDAAAAVLAKRLELFSHNDIDRLMERHEN